MEFCVDWWCQNLDRTPSSHWNRRYLSQIMYFRFCSKIHIPSHMWFLNFLMYVEGDLSIGICRFSIWFIIFKKSLKMTKRLFEFSDRKFLSFSHELIRKNPIYFLIFQIWPRKRHKYSVLRVCGTHKILFFRSEIFVFLMDLSGKNPKFFFILQNRPWKRQNYIILSDFRTQKFFNLKFVNAQNHCIWSIHSFGQRVVKSSIFLTFAF